VAFLCYFRDAVVFYAHLDMLSLSCAILEMLSIFFMLMWTCYHFLQMSSDDSSDESDYFLQNCLKWCYACPNIL